MVVVVVVRRRLTAAGGGEGKTPGPLFPNLLFLLFILPTRRRRAGWVCMSDPPNFPADNEEGEKKALEGGTRRRRKDGR